MVRPQIRALVFMTTAGAGLAGATARRPTSDTESSQTRVTYVPGGRSSSSTEQLQFRFIPPRFPGLPKAIASSAISPVLIPPDLPLRSPGTIRNTNVVDCPDLPCPFSVDVLATSAAGESGNRRLTLTAQSFSFSQLEERGRPEATLGSELVAKDATEPERAVCPARACRFN